VGLFTKSTKPPDDLRERGIKGTATVEKAHMAGLQFSESGGFTSKKKQEEYLTGEVSSTQFKLDLRVEVPGRDPYEASIKVPVPMMKTRYMSGGSVLPVLVDPDKPDRIAIDWDGEFQQGTIDQMAASDPLIAATMKGAGLDVEKIAEMQKAALAMGQTPSNVIIGGQMLGATPAPAAAPDPVDQLERLAKLRDSGALTQEEFDKEKAKLLAE
jgi:hypothetical protein